MDSANEDDKKVLQFPYPTFWLPGNEKQEEALMDKKETDATAKVADSSPSNMKIVPLKLSDNEKHVEKPEVVEEEAKTQDSMDRVAEKESKVKTIPVVYLDSVTGEKPCQLDKPEDVLKNSFPEEEKNDVAKKKDSGRKQSSPSKASKLPPVCLRVDPLPKKNGSNGKNRSPSPPSLKERVKTLEVNDGQVAILKNDSENVPIKDIKVIDVKYQPSGEEGEGTAVTIVSGQGMEGIEEQHGVKNRKDGTIDVVPVEGNLGNNNEEKGDISISQQQKLELKGAEVDLSDDDKKKIQKKYSQDGLHPSLREVRKSVARDLVHLQDKVDHLYSQSTEKQEGETLKEEITTHENTDSSITLTSAEKTPLIENILSDHLPHLKEENVSVQESGGSLIACDKPSCVSLEDDVQDPEGQCHVVPVKILNDEVVPSGDGKYVTRHHEDENLSVETKAGIDEKSMNQDVVHPSQSEISNFVLKPKTDDDKSTNCKEIQAVEAPDLNDLKHNTNEDSASNSSLAVQQINTHEKDKQSFLEELELKAKLASEKAILLEEASDFKPEEAIAEKNEEAIVEESNVRNDAFDASEELKPSFQYADESIQSDESQVEQELTGMNANQSSDVEKDETQSILSVKADSEMKESAQTEESAAASPVLKNSEIPQIDPTIVASIDDQGRVDFQEVDSRITHNAFSVVPENAAKSIECANNNNELLITSVASSGKVGFKETASDSSIDMSSESNLTEPSQHEKNTSDAILQGEMSYKENKLVEENEKQRQMLEKLLHAGQEQMEAINDLNERVKNLERKLTNPKKVRIKRRKKFYKISHSVLRH